MNRLIKNIYIHLPFCVKKCYFCAFPVHAIGQNKTQHTQKMLQNYFHHLKKQIVLATKNQYQTKDSQNYFKRNILEQSQIETIYFGGGTPSLFKPSQINQLVNLIKSISKPNKQNAEITLEINPQEIQMIPDFHSAGVNRFSIGLQSLNPYQLKKFNRSESFNFNLKQDQKEQKKCKEEYFQKITQKLLEHKRNKKLQNFNVDFILDLNPQKQDEEMIYQFLETIKPAHLTLYLLQVIENTYLERKIRTQKQKKNISIKEKGEFSGLVKNFQTIHERYIDMSNILKQKYGYSHYEVSNFALKQKARSQQLNKLYKLQQKSNEDKKGKEFVGKSIHESKHNKVYWQGDREFLGFGMGASSLLKGMHLNPYHKFFIPKVLKDQKLNVLKNNDNTEKDLTQHKINDMLFRVTNPRTIIKYEQYVNTLQDLINKKVTKIPIKQKEGHIQENFVKNQLELSQLMKVKFEYENVNNLVEISLQSYPVQVLQSYIMSSIRTLEGVRYDKIKSIIQQQQQKDNDIKQIDTNDQFQRLIQKIQTTLQQQLVVQKNHTSSHLESQQKNQQNLLIQKQNMYFEYLYSEQFTQNSLHQNQSQNDLLLSNKNTLNSLKEDKPQGFRLKSPHGYLIADQLANQISLLIQQVFATKH